MIMNIQLRDSNGQDGGHAIVRVALIRVVVTPTPAILLILTPLEVIQTICQCMFQLSYEVDTIKLESGLV